MIINMEVLKKFMSDKEAWSLVARMELERYKYSTYQDKGGNERKYSKRQALKNVNEWLEKEKQPPFTKDWVDKWWKRL